MQIQESERRVIAQEQDRVKRLQEYNVLVKGFVMNGQLSKVNRSILVDAQKDLKLTAEDAKITEAAFQFTEEGVAPPAPPVTGSRP